ncbi:MAG: hypothetical protein DMF63_13785 [Acidobacteria bacterium]|nr:MAG: hypothetical protein DMF63_13785 [Acidobacteriota bacterium]
MSFQIITFYEFKRFDPERLPELKESLRQEMKTNSIKGTIIVAQEGFNSTVCGEPEDVAAFVGSVEKILDTTLVLKSSFHAECPFRKVDVKIKPEIVTLKKPVDISKGEGTHVRPDKWNEVISDPSVVIVDTRNDYEYKNGTFKGAINPGTVKFSELPNFVAENLDPNVHHKVAMFCTGGIRCEKFAPYMKQLGFDEVYQLEGGILRYLEQVQPEESLWEGECFVFDDRRTVDEKLQKGTGPDYSQIPKADNPE